MNQTPSPGIRPGVRRGLAMLATTLVFALFGVGLLVAGARWWMPPTLAGPVGDGTWNSRSRAWFVADGFFEPEIDPTTLRRFSWTGRQAQLRIPSLPRTQRYRLSFRVSPVRPPGVPPPLLRVAVDNVVLVTAQTSNGRDRIAVDLPRRTTVGALVTLDVSDTFVPGPHDTRALGVVVDDVALTPATGHFTPAGRVLVQAWLALVACIGGVLLCGLRSRLAVVASAAVAAGFAWLLLYDGAFLGTYVGRLLHIGIGVALGGAVIAVARWRWPVVAELPEWPIAAGLVLAATAVKLALFAHPLATIGDGIFQVHRAMLVHGGKYLFTSITPRPFFEFPYPVALYVTAQPFWRFFPSDLDLVRLLRGLSVCADALVAVTLYAAARRQWGDRRTALLCAALWPFANAPLQALSNANLTNAFGQALFSAAMGALAWDAAGKRRSIRASILATGLLIAAFLSHFSTLSVGMAILGSVALVLFVGGRDGVRRSAVWVLAIALTACALSYVVYYSHFNSIYRSTIARVLSREGEALTRSIVAPPAMKFQRWITGAADDYGLPSIPVLAIAAAGGVLLIWRRRREALTLVLGGWLLVWIVFVTLGILSPIAMRTNLAVAPVFVCLAAYALAAMAKRSRVAATVAAAAALLVAWDGVRVCLVCIGLLDPRWYAG